MEWRAHYDNNMNFASSSSSSSSSSLVLDILEKDDSKCHWQHWTSFFLSFPLFLCKRLICWYYWLYYNTRRGRRSVPLPLHSLDLTFPCGGIIRWYHYCHRCSLPLFLSLPHCGNQRFIERLFIQSSLFLSFRSVLLFQRGKESKDNKMRANCICFDYKSKSNWPTRQALP